MRDNTSVYDPDEEIARSKARQKAQEEYMAGFERGAVGVTSEGVDIAYVRSFFADRIEEFDGGRVTRYDFPIWKTIGYVLSYDMDFPYSFLNTEPGEIPDLKRDLCGISDSLPAAEDQTAICEALKSYLVAAAALARRIGSSTYEGWRALLVQVEFEGRRGNVVFEGQGVFARFYKRLTELLRFLWADNEISQHNSIAQPHPPHPPAGA